MGKILVVGGYGEVGQHVVRTLAHLNQPVIVAGRSLQKAQSFVESLGDKFDIEIRKIDLADTDHIAQSLEDVSVAVMCTDQSNTHFAELCMASGITYLDITADYDFFSRIEAFDQYAKDNQSSAILSIGLAPGLTNLLAKDALKLLPNIDELEIGVLLGVGDSHGPQAVEWTFKNLLADKTGNANRAIDFGRTWGMRRSYAFNFSDQFSLRRTLKIQKITTYLTLSSKLMTYSLFLLRKPFLKPLVLKYSKFLSKVAGISVGSNKGYAIQIKGFIQGREVPLSRRLLTGEVEALVTGVVAAAVASYVKSNSIPRGVLHIDQVLEFADIVDVVRKYALVTLTGLKTSPAN